MKPRGWWISFPHSPALAHITVSSVELCLSILCLIASMLYGIRLPVNHLMHFMLSNRHFEYKMNSSIHDVCISPTKWQALRLNCLGTYVVLAGLMSAKCCLQLWNFDFVTYIYVYRLLDGTYTCDEVQELLHGLCKVVQADTETELISSTNMTVLLVKQLFEQAEKWHLRLQADLSELENRLLAFEIWEMYAYENVCMRSLFNLRNISWHFCQLIYNIYIASSTDWPHMV